MRKPKTCKIEHCDNTPERGALMCQLHLGQKRRCEGIVYTHDEETGEITDERQCKRTAKPGLTVCRDHGGAGRRLQAVSARTATLTAMQRFVQPYQGDLSPVTAFEADYRRTYGRILWLEEQIADFEDESDLIWGLAKTEEIGAAEYAGTNRTYEARIHGFEEMLRWERKHFLELTKLWIKAGLEEKKLSLMQENAGYAIARVREALVEMGHDPDDPAVREKVGRIFKRGVETNL